MGVIFGSEGAGSFNYFNKQLVSLNVNYVLGIYAYHDAKLFFKLLSYILQHIQNMQIAFSYKCSIRECSFGCSTFLIREINYYTVAT